MLLLAALETARGAAPAGPAVTAPKGPIDVGGAAAFAVSSPSAIWVDGCAAIELERHEGERWIPVSTGTVCDGGAPARRVQGTVTFTVVPSQPGEYRGVLAWGAGCTEGRSFALAGCSTVAAVRTGAFEVVQR